MYFSLIGTADGLQWCVLAWKGLVSTMAHPMPFLQLSYIHWQEQYLSHCCCNWTDHWDLEAIFSEKRMTNPEKMKFHSREHNTNGVFLFSFSSLERDEWESHYSNIIFMLFFQARYSMREWANQQIVTSFGRSIYDIHGNIKIRRKLKQWREIWKKWKGGMEKGLKRQRRLRFGRKKLEQISMLGRINTWYRKYEFTRVRSQNTGWGGDKVCWKRLKRNGMMLKENILVATY